MTDKTQYLIVGAGISGLAFADHLESDNYIVCEADSEIGGYCKTIKQDGFTWDYSGHFFHFKDESIERYLRERMEDAEIVKPRKVSKIFWSGEWIDFPFQKNIHQLPKSDLVDCIYGLHFRAEIEPTNFKEMLYSKFGKGIAERFLIPYNQKLYATDVGKLDVNAMGRFFPHADLKEIVSNFKVSDNKSYNDTFTYPSGGAIQYVNALARDIPKAKISLSEAIVSIDVKSRTAQTNMRSIQYENLISSAPLNRLVEMSGISCALESFSWNQVLVFNLGFDSKGMESVHWAYFPQPDLAFYRVGFYDNIMNSNRMSLYVELGVSRDVKIEGREVIELRDRVLDDLRKIGLVNNQKLVSWHSVLMNPAYVHITEKSLAEAARVRKILSAHGVYSIGRYGGWTYCSIEDNILEARALAETFNAI